MEDYEEILNQISADWDMENSISKQEFLKKLELKISSLLQQPESFFQLMYKLDISEKKLNIALADKENAVKQIAQLIYERQFQKATSRKQHNKNKDTKDTDLIW